MTDDGHNEPPGRVVSLFPDGPPGASTFTSIGVLARRLVDEVGRRDGHAKALAAEIASDRRFLQRVRRLCAKGPRVVAELLAEIAAERSIKTIVDGKLERYVGLPDDALQVTGGEQIPPAPLTPIDGGRD